MSRSIFTAVLVLVTAAAGHVAPAAAAPGRGLAEIPDAELNLMRGRYTVAGNNVAWFGVSMVSVWRTPNGSVLEGALTVGMDLRHGPRPVISFAPSVRVTPADAALPIGAAGSVDSSGLANVTGLVQSVQLAGDHNQARNRTTLLVRDGAVDATSAGSPAALSIVDGATQASADVDRQQVGLLLKIDGVGQVQQWVRSGSVGQVIALAGSGHQVDNHLQIELVRQGLASNIPLGQSVAQAIALGRGIGAGP